MKRMMMALMLMMIGVAASTADARAQTTVRVQLYWEWGDGGWIPHRSAYLPRRDAYRLGGYAAHLPRREVVYREIPRRIRVPPGHLPPPGYCRLWYPGRPPGHQPPPRPCGYLLGYRHPGAVILGAPVLGVRDRVRAGPRPGHGRGHGHRGRKRGKGHGHD